MKHKQTLGRCDRRLKRDDEAR